MKKVKLTDKQKELYLFIVEYVLDYHNFPAVRICKEGTSYGAHSAVWNTISRTFVKKGLVKMRNISEGKSEFSVVGLQITPPEFYLDLKNPTWSAGLRDLLTEDRGSKPS